MEKIIAMVQPIGHAHQMPVAPRAVPDNTKARTTRKIKSVNVAIINCFIIPAQRRIPSATSFTETTK